MEASAYDGIYDLFAFLRERGIPTAIATYKSRIMPSEYAEDSGSASTLI